MRPGEQLSAELFGDILDQPGGASSGSSGSDAAHRDWVDTWEQDTRPAAFDDAEDGSASDSSSRAQADVDADWAEDAAFVTGSNMQEHDAQWEEEEETEQAEGQDADMEDSVMVRKDKEAEQRDKETEAARAMAGSGAGLREVTENDPMVQRLAKLGGSIEAAVFGAAKRSAAYGQSAAGAVQNSLLQAVEAAICMTAAWSHQLLTQGNGCGPGP